MVTVTLPGFPPSPRRPGEGAGEPGQPGDPRRAGPPGNPPVQGDTRPLRQSGRQPSGQQYPGQQPSGQQYPGQQSPGQQPADPQPTGPREPKITVTRVAASRAKQLSHDAVVRIGNASRADGADKSGLTKLIWMNVVQTGGDAMIALALANTIFFAAATSQQRGNVALYLAVTMAPFAVIAPVIGPLLDKLQHGRRVALAGTMIGRALVAWIMAQNFHNIGFYPAVLGFLVLSKAYNVLKAACVPRVLPERLTLVRVNARLSIFALGGTVIGGGFAGLIVKIGGSSWTLRVAALVFIAAAVLAWRLPKHVDSSHGERPAQLRSTGGSRRSRRAFDRPVLTAVQGSAALRGLSGFLTLFLAFYLQHRYHGFDAAVALGSLAVAAGGGSFLGTAAGARLKLARPDLVVLVCAISATALCALTAVIYNVGFAVATALVTGIANSLGKLSLDAIIQRDVPDAMRASAFGRSETALQLAWVAGGAIGITLPMNGRLAFGVAALILGAAIALIVFIQRGGQLPSIRPSRRGRSGPPTGTGPTSGSDLARRPAAPFPAPDRPQPQRPQ